MAIFPGGPRLASTILDFIRAKDDRDGGGNWSYMTCKAPVKASPPTNQHPALQGWTPFLSPNQQHPITEGKQFKTNCFL